MEGDKKRGQFTWDVGNVITTIRKRNYRCSKLILMRFN